MADGKKRRKKKLKKSISQANSEPVDHDSPESMSTNDQSVPEEMIQIKQEQPSIVVHTDDQLVKSAAQAMPMNLTSEHGKVKTEIDPLGYGSAINETIEMNEFSNTVCKIGNYNYLFTFMK